MGNIRIFKLASVRALAAMEQEYREGMSFDMIPLANGTPYEELATVVFPPVGEGCLYLCRTVHLTQLGLHGLGESVLRYLTGMSEHEHMDILSVSVGIVDNEMVALSLLRMYPGDNAPDLSGLFTDTAELDRADLKTEQGLAAADPVMPPDPDREEKLAAQKRLFAASDGLPPLGRTRYVREIPDAGKIPVYDLTLKERDLVNGMSYEAFVDVFAQAMRYITNFEREPYYQVLRGENDKAVFMDIVADDIDRVFIRDRRSLAIVDRPALMAKIEKALFDLYIVGDLIDDPDITDIKITAPDSVRVRIKGKAYLSNVAFLDREDYMRFYSSIMIRNRRDGHIPTQTFVDDISEEYALRYAVTAPYITPSGFPIIHIRKVSKKKPMSDDLIAAGMFDENVRDYLIDCGKLSRGVVFAGPPGSGKTTCLNWFLEDAYEDSAEILVIQENDELFAYRKGVMFEHVVTDPAEGDRRCTLEDLGRMALVAGANVFVIGEAKGGEMSSAITLANSGCRTAITIHSPSASQTIDKMADLAMRGYASSYEQAKRMLTSFQTIVYLSDYKVQEITEITGFDEEKKDVTYRYIYRR